MDVEWGSLSPYVKGVLLGGVIGAALFLIASFLLHPGFPGDVTWSPHMMTMIKVGALVGAVAGAAFVGALRFVDARSGPSRLRILAERRDRSVVSKLAVQVVRGDETQAWHAVALLANYCDPYITTRMLHLLLARLQSETVETSDRMALARHAIGCVLATEREANIAVLDDFAKDITTEVGIQMRRLISDRENVTLE